MKLLENPVFNNVVAAGIVGVYVKATVAICDALLKAKLVAKEVSRKIIHVAAGCWLVFWPLFDASHASWRLNVLVPAVYCAILLVKGLGGAPPTDPDVQAMSRTGDHRELLRGPLYFASAMVAVGLVYFGQDAAYYIMAPLTFGDGLAPLVGARFAHFGGYRTLGRPKTFAGSAACFLFGVLGCRLFAALGRLQVYDWHTAVTVAAVATVVEALSPSDVDDVLIPVAVALTLRMT